MSLRKLASLLAPMTIIAGENPAAYAEHSANPRERTATLRSTSHVDLAAARAADEQRRRDQHAAKLARREAQQRRCQRN